MYILTLSIPKASSKSASLRYCSFLVTSTVEGKEVGVLRSWERGKVVPEGGAEGGVGGGVEGEGEEGGGGGGRLGVLGSVVGERGVLRLVG